MCVDGWRQAARHALDRCVGRGRFDEFEVQVCFQLQAFRDCTLEISRFGHGCTTVEWAFKPTVRDLVYLPSPLSATGCNVVSQWAFCDSFTGNQLLRPTDSKESLPSHHRIIAWALHTAHCQKTRRHGPRCLQHIDHDPTERPVATCLALIVVLQQGQQMQKQKRGTAGSSVMQDRGTIRASFYSTSPPPSFFLLRTKE